jgi:L-ascorbate metabolism protein UlaG (beta-lactamase superfamily)
MDQVYLRSNIQVEPLVDQWYAWPHLVAPATSARNATERHAKIMQSYISAPEIHANAVKNPKMLGGPFIDHGGRRVDEIKELLDRTILNQPCLRAFSRALEDLDKMLQSKARGESLHPLYALVPEVLKGYVELVYDLNNHPSYRLIEPLLYRSELYRAERQSIMMSHLTGDDRPFVLSTPRLPESDVLHMKLPFRSDALDRLFDAKRNPVVVEELLERCGVGAQDEALFRSFFTPDRPAIYERYQGNGIRWRYFGHACILVETRTTTFLFDPVLSYTYESGISRYTYDDLPEKIDYVLITHNHQDHVLLETLLQLRHKVSNIVVPRCGGGALEDPSLKLILENIGFKQVLELDELDTVNCGDGEIVALPFMGEHADLNIRSKLAYLMRLGDQKLMFAADSCNVEPALYMHLQREIGDVRTLFVGMECDGAPLSWLYGPLLSRRMERAQDESRRLSGSNYCQAMEIIKLLNCKEVFVYAMGQEPWLNYIMSIKYTSESHPLVQSNKLIATCREQGLLAERLFGEREMLLH